MAPQKKVRPKLAFDQALIRAKREKKMVDIELAFPIHLPEGRTIGEEGTFGAEVCHVDTYAVQFKIAEREVWISKGFIVAVWPR